MLEYLPKDICVQIFLRLDVKTILRCVSVCKLWQMFIQHPSFIKAHLQNQRSDLMFVRYIPKINTSSSLSYETTIQRECYSINCDDLSFTMYTEHRFPILLNDNFRVVGSCNGVICISNDQVMICHDTFLWNPTIRKLVELPRPNFTYGKIGGFDHELGFGFDEKTNDYKVVRIVDKVDLRETLLEVEIYSLKSGIWRKASDLASNLGVRNFHRYSSSRLRNCQVYFNGAVHWVLRDIKRNSCLIIAFDLSDESFHCFEPPMGIDNVHFWMQMLRPVVFQGSLSLIHYNKPRCVIWIMREYGNSSSWTKHLDIVLSDKVNKVIAIRNKGELLIEIKGGLFSYDPETTKGKRFNFLEGVDLLHWNLIREGYTDELSFVRDEVRNYDPEAAPKELGIREHKSDYLSSFHSERYIESLAMLGESERMLEEGSSSSDCPDEEGTSREIVQTKMEECSLTDCGAKAEKK